MRSNRSVDSDTLRQGAGHLYVRPHAMAHGNAPIPEDRDLSQKERALLRWMLENGESTSVSSNRHECTRAARVDAQALTWRSMERLRGTFECESWVTSSGRMRQEVC